MTTWPQPSTCQRCEAPVLLARHGGTGSVCLDPSEVLPLGECGTCKGRGRVWFHAALTGRGGRVRSCLPGDLYGRTTATHGICPECNGSGQRGEEPGPAHILLHAIHGTARPYEGQARRWEALHRRHECIQLPVRSESPVSQAPRGMRDGARRPTASET